MENKNVKMEKNLSSFNVWALALGSIIGWGAFVMPADTFLRNGGVLGTIIAMTLAAVIMITIALNYNFMINEYPVAGGEYVYTKEAFGVRHAFVCAWFLGLSYLAIVPLNGTALALIGRNLMGNIFQVGFHYTFAGYDIYAGEIILAVGAVILLGYLSIRGAKLAGVFQTLLVILLVGGIAIVSVAAIFNPDVTLSNLSPAYHPEVGKWTGILAVLSVAPWAFVGFDTVPQAAEEFSFSHKKTIMVMILSIVFGAAVYIILTTVTAAVVPVGYESWVEYNQDLPNLTGLKSLPTFYAAYTLLGNAGLILLGFSVCAAILSGILGFYMATSRLLYAMALDGVIPKTFGKLSVKYKTPVRAILFVLLVSCIAPFFGRTALGWIVDMSSTGAAIGYGYTSAAALKMAHKVKNKRVMITGTIGVIVSLIFIIILLVPLPGLNCSLGKESYFFFGLWCILGIVFYLKSDTHKSHYSK